LGVTDDGKPTLAIGKVTVVFEGIHMRHDGKAAALSEGIFHVPHRGEKTTGGTAGVNDLKISESFADDMNTISLNDQSFKLIENGTKLAFSDRTVALDDGAQTIAVAKDGTTQVRK
jgi:hypothetical protein